MADFRSRRWAAWWPWPLTFRPLNGVTGHPCHRLPSLSIITFLRPSILDLGSGTGQTDRRTDRRRPSNALCPTLWERGYNKWHQTVRSRKEILSNNTNCWQHVYVAVGWTEQTVSVGCCWVGWWAGYTGHVTVGARLWPRTRQDRWRSQTDCAPADTDNTSRILHRVSKISTT